MIQSVNKPERYAIIVEGRLELRTRSGLLGPVIIVDVTSVSHKKAWKPKVIGWKKVIAEKIAALSAAAKVVF